MSAIKLEINDYKAILSDKSINMIVDKAISDIDNYNLSYYQDEIVTANGFMIEVHVKYEGCSYRRIVLSWLQVCFWDNQKNEWLSDDECIQYTEKISERINERINDLNDQEEKYYESEMYTEPQY